MTRRSYSPSLFTPAPVWVVDDMERAGLGHAITTHRRIRATPRWHSCGEPVWTGLADREDVIVDPAPTTVDGELYAILTGRRTYQIDDHGEIRRRRPAHIRHANADQVRVYIAHQCAGPYPPVNDRWAPIAKSDNDRIPY